ncbi:MAG: CDP-alcohol phosphatidyltransferase family protein [Tannerella sp.]|jgi:hypothetical protein|nr:CDP-alcohol phosphatidyltransferase family protein [Tannerella sp.]
MNKEFESSLKSIETENIIDLYFYRPIGYQIARALKKTKITPNMVTIFSLFVGIGTGYLFYFNNLYYNLLGIFIFIVANLLDCVDGQLARLSGIKSEFGRILDGAVGDIWFTLIYASLALRLTNEYGTAWFFVPALISGASHLLQANITDYYKTLHLYFVSIEKGVEFQKQAQVEARRKTIKNKVEKFFYTLYVGYTGIQEELTPSLQYMLYDLYICYGDDIPDNLRVEFRRQSSRLMKRYIDLLTFNGRTIVLFLIVLSGYVWIYFIYETIVLNIVLYIAIHKHERMCRQIHKKIE